MDMEFYDEHASPVISRIQHEDNHDDSCKDIYQIHC